MIHQKCVATCALIGFAHKQPALDIHIYEVHFTDGCSKELAANVIDEVVYAQCDLDGNEYVLLDSILNYWCNRDVVVSSHDQVKVVDDKKVVLCSTHRWKLCCT